MVKAQAKLKGFIMADKLLELILTELPQETNFNRWLLTKFNDPAVPCSLNEFAAFYLNLVKTQTDEFIKSNTSACNTPRKLTASNLNEQVGECLPKSTNMDNSELFVLSENQLDNREKRKPSRKLFLKQDASSFNRSGAIESSTPATSFSKSQRSFDGTPTNTSTPQSHYKNSKNSFSMTEHSPAMSRNTSRNSLDLSSRNTSANRRNTSSPFCLGDFINTPSLGKGKKKTNQSLNQTPLFNSSDFPSIGENTSKETAAVKDKPKKRVAPITISTKVTPNSSNFISSSFQSDNNLLNLTGSEADESFGLISERRMLRDERDSISNDFINALNPQRNLHAMVRESFPSVTQSPRKAPFKFDESKVERKDIIVLMSKIYSFLLDMNLVPNVLSEFTYFFSLLNTDQEPTEQPSNQTEFKKLTEIASIVLTNIQNCVFFSIHVLNCQKHNLGLLDVMTIRVIIDNERSRQLTSSLIDFLTRTVQTKSEMSLQGNNNTGELRQVFFQQETDNRDNFPSDREFGAFKKQRDLFYDVLRFWELKHLEANYDCRTHLQSKIQHLVNHMVHPANMAHLARLFTAQLIISCNFDNATNELQTVLPNIDLSKLSKLRQRLVAPSQFSTQYLFPGSQAFFRDFITSCEQHLVFMEQLKISLINSLMQINDSTMDVFCITVSNDDDKRKRALQEEFIVRADAITTMRVLAKFVGFVVSRPYSYEGYRNTLVDQKQSEMRNFLHPDFDVKQVVVRAKEEHKLLVTIPWLVEYLSMLDFITIRLNYYRDLFQLLHEIYLQVNVVNESGSLCVLPTSKFIIRSCLGWLFEHPVFPQEFFFDKNFANVVLNDIVAKESKANFYYPPNPHLEGILNAACPFLADFRVSIMPLHTTKVVSRTGRYRHITTKFQDKSSVQNTKVQDNRSRLIDAFLASQTVSVKKIVDFTIDRVSSAVIKDFQVEHLLVMKKLARAEAEKEAKEVKELNVLMKKNYEVYKLYLSLLQKIWIEETKTNSCERVKNAFQSLLPIETLPDVKKTLVNITIEKTREKLQEWRSANLTTIEVFSKDLQSDAAKFQDRARENGRNGQQVTVIDLTGNTMPSAFFNTLQNFLYKATKHPEKIESNELLNMIKVACEVVQKQIVNDNAFRNIAFYMLQAVLMCIANRCDIVTEESLRMSFILWRHEKLLPYTRMKEKTLNNQMNRKTRKVNDFIFSNVISARFMLTLQGKPHANLEKYADFIMQLVIEKFINIEQVDEQSVRLYKHEWSTQSLNDIAFLINRLVDHSKNQPSSQDSRLFLELVVDLARDMENF